MKHSFVISTIFASLSLFACSSNPSASGTDRPMGEKPAEYTYEVVNTFPHDPHAYTQGLVFDNGELFESTGRYGDSSLRRVELATGKVLQKVDISKEYFAEGMAILNEKVFQLTWREGRTFVYDLKTLQKTSEFEFSGDGWGLTDDGQSLIMTDGTNRIRFIDPSTFKTRRTIKVEENGKALMNLNELEFVKGEIFANIWQQQRIARIDPKDGKLLGMIDLRGILETAEIEGQVDVLNGIAYDAAGDRLFVTGKLWPKLFEIRLKKRD